MLIKLLNFLGVLMLICKFYSNGANDIAYWVSVSDFRKHFNQYDFIENRDAKTIIEAYSEKWFFTDSLGATVFELPAVSVIDGKTQFLSGRHRVSVLINYVEFLPIAFSPSAKNLARNLNFKAIDTTKTIELPELPFKKYD
jgi:hypothetical protein